MLANLRAIIEDAGGSLDDVVTFVTFVCRGESDGPPAYRAISAVIQEALAPPNPTHTMVEVPRLVDPDALVETYAIAALG